MAKNPGLMIVLGVAPKKGAGRKDSRAASLEKLNKMATIEAASRKKDEEDEGGEWTCPECGTAVMATMNKSSMECPCCGADMEEDEYEGDEEEDEEEGD